MGAILEKDSPVVERPVNRQMMRWHCRMYSCVPVQLDLQLLMHPPRNGAHEHLNKPLLKKLQINGQQELGFLSLGR